MVIKSATALHNNYDKMVQLSKERQEPIFITHSGRERWYSCPRSCGKSRRPNWTCWRKFLRRGRSRVAGARTSTMDEMRAAAGEILDESSVALRGPVRVPRLSHLLQDQSWVQICQKFFRQGAEAGLAPGRFPGNGRTSQGDPDGQARFSCAVH